MTLAASFIDVQNDDITHHCEHCTQLYLVKYWDEELDWYIEVNETPLCPACHKEKKSDWHIID